MEQMFLYPDRHTASIELSNKCREFYKKRMLQAETTRERLSLSRAGRHNGTTSSIHQAMEKLRHEMSTLMDQDLSLMRQLLLLNEAIEDLKSSRANSSCGTSRNFSESEISVYDVYNSDDKLCVSQDNAVPDLQFVFPERDQLQSMKHLQFQNIETCNSNDAYDSGCESVTGPSSP